MDYNLYIKQLQEPYKTNPIDISIGFFAMCSYQPDAWDYVFSKIREHYPDCPIVLMNDGLKQYDYTDMAKKYNCIYIQKDKNICLLWNDIKDSHEFLHRTKEACNLLNTEWLINLHPDVICQNKISYYPPSFICGVGAGSITGISNNNFNSSNEWRKIDNYIRKLQPNIKLNGWGFCGGSIMNIEKFNEVYKSIYCEKPIIILEDIEFVYKEAVKYEDTLLPILFNIFGYEYRIWKDNPEYHRREKEGAFLHGYKKHYDFYKKGETIDTFNKRRLLLQ